MENVVNGEHIEPTGTSSSSNHASSPATSSSSGGGGDAMVYDEAFPSLPTSGGGLGGAGIGSWSASPVGTSTSESKMHVRSRNQHTSQMIHLTPEERKSQPFGTETRKKCEEIAGTMGVKVEMYVNRDQTLHINISGNEDKVLEAKRAIVNELKVEVESKMKIPKDQHKFLIGKNGAILKGRFFCCC